MATTDPNESINVTQKLDLVENGHHELETKLVPDTDGLTKREYLAGQAMAGYMANYYTPHQDPLYIAEYSVRVADALINALNAKIE